jgi:hypothetical protein
MRPGGPLEVPVVWLWAEQAAERLIAASDGSASPATFEFRATRDVLALTLFLTGVAARPAELSTRQLALIQDRLPGASQWLAWCASRLETETVVAGGADLDLARNAWLWLGRSRLLAASAPTGPACVDAATRMGAGSHIGLAHARRIVAARLSGGFEQR